MIEMIFYLFGSVIVFRYDIGTKDLYIEFKDGILRFLRDDGFYERRIIEFYVIILKMKLDIYD